MEMRRAELNKEEGGRWQKRGSTRSIGPFKVEWSAPEQICLEQRPDRPRTSISDLLGETLSKVSSAVVSA